ncbi:hypothetical protein F7725_012422 [Dissostichus mawsoni]|uniref:Uncharacterized protein n=1 Tax=Dissostichus mawsoni TaxID=36200 RepID=A0A7J5YMQ7_DISMA|nr:hypothetical protein F7725_012422 [Dissostichus mawsoni]
MECKTPEVLHGEGDAPVVLPPAQDIFIGVGPQQVAQQTLVRHVRRAHDASDLLHGLQVSQQQADGLQRLLPPVHVVPQEQVVALGGEAAVLKQPQQVVLQQDGLTEENLPGFQAQSTDLVLLQLHISPASLL